MYADMVDDEEIQRENEPRKRHSNSKQRRLNRSPSLKKHRSPTKKRTDSIKLPKEEIKYQRFVNNLRNDVHTYLNRCFRESHFDPSSSRDLSARTRRIHATNNTVNNHRQRSMKSWKDNEHKRLNADVNDILTGPSLKILYTEFIKPPTPVGRFRSLDRSLPWSNKQG